MFFRQVGEKWRTDRDPAWGWSELGDGREGIRLSAHEWKLGVWEHDVLVVRPNWESGLEGCYLEVTGEDAGEVDLTYAQDLADIGGLPVAVLFQIPNQPLWEMWEDDLIAHTFEQFLETGDKEWPLLVPMVRSVWAAMDALEEAYGFSEFLVGGASKRGWTSWLTAASGDSRVKGIVPMVFDNLKMDEQMRRQMTLWGRPSDMVDDYVRRQLHLIEQSKRGPELVSMVDPWQQLSEVACSALVVNGANDRYWAVDALQLYYNGLPKGSGAVVVPNLGHSTGSREFWGPALFRFAESVFGSQEFPKVVAKWDGRFLDYSVSIDPVSVTVWTADSSSPEFWDAGWTKSLKSEGAGKSQVEVPAGDQRFRAALVAFEFSDDEGFWRLTSPATFWKN